jgi:hypothetical protein
MKGRVSAPGVSRTIESFTVTADEGQIQFQLTATISAEDYIEVLLDGRELVEGADKDWTRDVDNKRINTIGTINKTSTIKVKIYQ